MISSKTLALKDSTSNKYGISEENLNKIYDYISESISSNLILSTNARIYATGLFRKISTSQQNNIKQYFNEKSNLCFSIISQELENYYLEKSTVINNYNFCYMVINIGGASTELVFMKNGAAQQRINLDIGVQTLLSQFNSINDEVYIVNNKKDILSFVQSKLCGYCMPCDFAVYTGGELTYMERMDYPLLHNGFFKSVFFPYQLHIQAYQTYTEQIYKTPMDDLKNRMPENPSWMIGAKACSILAESIFEYYNIDTIIPTDANLVTGVFQSEFRSAILIGFQENYSLNIQNQEGKFIFFDRSVENFISRFVLPAIEEIDVVIVNCHYNDLTKTELILLGVMFAYIKSIVFLHDSLKGDVPFPVHIGMPGKIALRSEDNYK